VKELKEVEETEADDSVRGAMLGSGEAWWDDEKIEERGN
jgi:hypothetical protein